MRASASRLATVQWARARAKSASLVRRSLHTPRPPEAIATVYGSLTGQNHPRPGTCRGRRRRSAQTRRPTLGRSSPGSGPGGRSGIGRPRARDRGAGMRRELGPITPVVVARLWLGPWPGHAVAPDRYPEVGDVGRVVLQPLEVTTAGEPICAARHPWRTPEGPTPPHHWTRRRRGTPRPALSRWSSAWARRSPWSIRLAQVGRSRLRTELRRASAGAL